MVHAQARPGRRGNRWLRLPSWFLLALLVGSVGCVATEPGSGPDAGHRHVQLGVGPVAFGGGGWDAYEGRVAVSLGTVLRKPATPWGFEGFLQFARIEPKDPDDPMGPRADTDSVDVLELRGGLAWAHRPWERVELVAGAGPRLAFASTTYPGEFNEEQERASSLGLYVHGGVHVRFATRWWIGFEGHAAAGTGFDLGDEDRSDQQLGALIVLRLDF